MGSRNSPARDHCRGKVLVENYGSSISAFETRQAAPSANETTVTIHNSTISGQLSVGNQNELTQRTGANAAEFAQLIKAVLDAASETDQQDRVSKIVTQLQIEVDDDEPDQTIVSKILDRLEKVANITQSPALLSAASALVTFIHNHFVWLTGGS